MRRTIIVASREIEYDLRNDLFWKLEQQPPAFYNRMPTGDIMSRTTNDINAVRSVLLFSTHSLPDDGDTG